jgi:DNA-binding NarL/FixJ family response regulator
MEIPVTPEANPETIVETLTPREVEVLQAITLGMSNPDIAAVLTLSLDTVKTHVKSILQKLRARNRTHAVVCALMAGIVLLPAATPIATKIKATKAAVSQQANVGRDLG